MPAVTMMVRRFVMRKVLIVGLVLAFVAAVPTAVLAASGRVRSSGGFSSSLDLQASKWTTASATTSSTAFAPIPGLSGLNICALNQVTAALSVELSGAPASFQIHVDGGPIMPPGRIRFVPAGPHDSFSFDFIMGVSSFENNDHHVFDVEWRSPTEKPAVFERGTFNLQYQKGTHSC
jgi:hypothetical protein